MSEEMNRTDAQKQNNEVQSLLSIEEHEEFDPIFGSKYISAKELCETTSSIFKQVFGDFEGCVLGGITGTNQLEIKLYFNHANNNPDMAKCCSKEIDDEGTKNSLLLKTRRYNSRMTQGDRYFVTEEGKATLAPLLVNSKALLQNNGTINWGKICSEVADTSTQYDFVQMRQQYTAISFIDPVKIIELVYGTESTDETGATHKWVYNLRVANSIPTLAIQQNVNSPMNWMLCIDRISEEETEKLARRYGFSMVNGLDMVR